MKNVRKFKNFIDFNQFIEYFHRFIKNNKIYFKDYNLFKLYKTLGICLNANF
jgi:hypothetical protein